MEKGGEECYGLHGLFCSPPPPLHTYMLCYLPFQLLGPLVHHCEELPGNQANGFSVFLLHGRDWGTRHWGFSLEAHPPGSKYCSSIARSSGYW